MESKVFWIDANIDNEENTRYIYELEKFYSIKVTPFNIVYKAIQELKNKDNKFIELKIIVSGILYNEFIKMFKDEIINIFVAPKIIVFTKNVEKFKEINKEYENIDNIFYSSYGVVNSFFEIINFLKEGLTSNKINIPDCARLTFEYIDKKEKLLLPLFFKTLIEKCSNEDMKNYTSDLYTEYSVNSDNVKNLLGSIMNMSNIPVEILSKYYARLYTIESDFYKKINEDLSDNKVGKYLPFIKTLYEGVKYQSLPLSTENVLYRGSKISNDEIISIYENKKKGLTIVFSKSFLSFSKQKEKAELFLNKGIIGNNLSRVLFILEKDNKIGYNLATHGDLKDVSIYPNEQEVLFFPFSSFEIKDIKEIKIDNEKRYEIRLLYLGKYLKNIENDKALIEKVNNILPYSKFKNQLTEAGLIKKEKIEKINTKEIYTSYKTYEKEINEIREMKEIKMINEIYADQDNKNNEIVAEIDITDEKKILIINSYENATKNNENNKNEKYKYSNENEIKENIEIKINGKSIPFSYEYKFKKIGKYQIKYIFKNPLTKTNHMFFDCMYIRKLDLSEFNTKKITNMSCMFYNCKYLKNIDLSNFNTKNVKNMSYMFGYCDSLKNLDLSSFNTENVTDMNNMFFHCENLVYLDLSNFITTNVVNMSYMFSGIKSMKYLDLTNFNTIKVQNISDIFFNSELVYDKNVTTSDKKIINELPQF